MEARSEIRILLLTELLGEAGGGRQASSLADPLSVLLTVQTSLLQRPSHCGSQRTRALSHLRHKGWQCLLPSLGDG